MERAPYVDTPGIFIYGGTYMYVYRHSNLSLTYCACTPLCKIDNGQKSVYSAGGENWKTCIDPSCKIGHSVMEKG